MACIVDGRAERLLKIGSQDKASRRKLQFHRTGSDSHWRTHRYYRNLFPEIWDNYNYRTSLLADQHFNGEKQPKEEKIVEALEPNRAKKFPK